MTGRAQRGRPRVIEGPQAKFLLRLPAKLHYELRVFASTQRLSMNALLLKLIDEWWRDHPMRGTIAPLTSPKQQKPGRARRTAEGR